MSIAELEGKLLEVVAEFSGRVGYSVTNITTGENVSHRAAEDFPTASTVKLPVLTAFHAFVEGGGAAWSDSVRVDREDVPGGSGILSELSLPRDICYSDAAWLMICLSDNLATNVLLQAMTLETTNALIAEHMGADIRVNKLAGFIPNAPVRSMGTATPAAMGRYLEDLVADRLPGSQQTLAVARGQVYTNTIPRFLPTNSYASGGLSIANKTGSLPGICADMAVVTGKSSTITMAFMTSDSLDLGDSFANEGQVCIAKLARIVYDAWGDEAA